MATGLYIDASQLTKGAVAFEALAKALPKKVDDVLNANALEIEGKAKRAAPANTGMLRRSIKANTEKPLVKHITANVNYAAYVEFGTGKYAADYVSGLPAEYADYAAGFKGSKRIIKNGMYPRPYLIPSLINQIPQLKTDLINLLNLLK
jgi:hypothetical protein